MKTSRHQAAHGIALTGRRSRPLEMPTVPTPRPKPLAEARTYWENHGPRDWRPVPVRVRYGDVAGVPDPVLPLVRTVALASRNVLVERRKS
ncbi:hypothetical protein GCM10009574_073690 [Streptomyces asiaticus]|uniref:Uncharacterized protein n=2 Tax=Streptomyces rhizosphaericus TaxID=114699 RepID=A0ABN1NZV9_9ACTN